MSWLVERHRKRVRHVALAGASYRTLRTVGPTAELKHRRTDFQSVAGSMQLPLAIKRLCSSRLGLFLGTFIELMPADI
jgi:hypothetical protein